MGLGLKQLGLLAFALSFTLLCTKAHSQVDEAGYINPWPPMSGVVGGGFSFLFWLVTDTSTTCIRSTNGGGNQSRDYGIRATQDNTGLGFVLKNRDNANDTLTINSLVFTPQDGTVSTTLTDGDETGIIYTPTENLGTGVDCPTMTMTVSGGFFAGTGNGVPPAGTIYQAIITVCVYNQNPNQCEDRPLYIGVIGNTTYSVVVMRLDDISITPNLSGGDSEGSDDFCLGTDGAIVTLTAESANGGGGVFELNGPALLEYQVNLAGRDLTEGNAVQIPISDSQVGTLNECLNGANPTNLTVKVPSATVSGAAAGDYTDTLILSVQHN